jgi:hypothetical protein
MLGMLTGNPQRLFDDTDSVLHVAPGRVGEANINRQRHQAHQRRQRKDEQDQGLAPFECSTPAASALPVT